jgi:adenosine deaminase
VVDLARTPEDLCTLTHEVARDLTAQNVRYAELTLTAEHPIPAFVAAGVPVTVSSDDPPMFGTTLSHEYEVAADLLGLDDPEVADLARAAVKASFLDAPGKQALLDEIDEHAGTPPTRTASGLGRVLVQGG